MKRLLLLRHAKSDWRAPYDHDHNRPLAARGERAARLVGRFLRAVDRVPDHVVSSSAVRARTTVELAAREGAWFTDNASAIEVTRTLYGAAPSRLIEMVCNQDETIATLMLVGHEPTWSSLLSTMIGGGEHRFPTAAVASIRFDTNTWRGLDAGAGMLEWLVTPKLLGRFEAAGFKAAGAHASS